MLLSCSDFFKKKRINKESAVLSLASECGKRSKSKLLPWFRSANNTKRKKPVRHIEKTSELLKNSHWVRVKRGNLSQTSFTVSQLENLLSVNQQWAAQRQDAIPVKVSDRKPLHKIAKNTEWCLRVIV